ncbi:MAG: hypothetical protein ACF8XB_16355, partial [Planctomycetota bacterium JB042]
MIATRGPGVSLFLPTHRRPRVGARDAVLLESLLRDARERLEASPAGLDERAIDATLAPAR